MRDMFYLRKIGWGAKTGTTAEDEFGWWIGDRGAQNSVIPKRSANFFSGLDNDSLSSRLNNHVAWLENERIKWTDRQEINLDLIEKDARNDVSARDEETDEWHSYTPERIVQSQSFRTLTPSPKFLSLPETTSAADVLRSQIRRRKIARLIDTRFIGASNLQTLLGAANPVTRETALEKEALNCTKRHKEDCDPENEPVQNGHSPREDSSGEKFINGAVTMLNSSENDDANFLLEEDKFYDANSSHDQPTRLALTIEPTIIDDPKNLVRGLRGKVEELEDASRDIRREIWSLKKEFQYDEWKINHLSTAARELREDIHEMRYLDDLLSLLHGEVERISRRNWPFALRREECEPEEINLVI